MATAKRRSLAQAASARVVRPGPSCWLCSLPELKEIHEEHAKGVKVVAILEWLLEDCGYKEATKNRIVNHFGNRHHLRGK